MNLRTLALVGEVASVAHADEVSLQLQTQSHLPTQLASFPVGTGLVVASVLEDVAFLASCLLLSQGYDTEVNAGLWGKRYVACA